MGLETSSDGAVSKSHHQSEKLPVETLNEVDPSDLALQACKTTQFFFWVKTKRLKKKNF